MQQRRREAGFTSLVGVLVAMAVMLVLMAALLPASLRLEQVNNESAAAEKLAQIGAAETAAGQLYGQYMTLDKMGGTLAAQNSCVNPNLLSGAQTQAPAGYELIVPAGSFNGVPANPASGCVGGFATYTIYMEPTSRLSGQRYFAMAQDGNIYFAVGKRATVGVNLFPVSVISQNVGKYIQVASTTQQNCPSGYSGTPPNCVASPIYPSAPGGTYDVNAMSASTICCGGAVNFTGTLTIDPVSFAITASNLSNGCTATGNLGAAPTLDWIRLSGTCGGLGGLFGGDACNIDDYSPGVCNPGTSNFSDPNMSFQGIGGAVKQYSGNQLTLSATQLPIN